MSEMKPITRKEKIIAGENIPPITREEMFLNKYGGGGGSTVQSDLAQNDPTKPDYVKNRTHWVETTPIIEQQTIEGFAVMEDSIDVVLYMVQNPFVFTPTVGQKYIVHWDGDEYSVDAKELDGMLYIGNENYVNKILGGDIPFAIIFDGSDVFVATESTAASHTICIRSEVVHKLDKKYLPDDVGGDVVYFFAKRDSPYVYLDFNNELISSREDVIDAIDRGAKVILINVDDASKHHPLIYADTELGCLVFEYFTFSPDGRKDYRKKYTGEYAEKPS